VDRDTDYGMYSSYRSSMDYSTCGFLVVIRYVKLFVHNISNIPTCEPSGYHLSSRTGPELGKSPRRYTNHDSAHGLCFTAITAITAKSNRVEV
jgi:hypothetical protein